MPPSKKSQFERRTNELREPTAKNLQRDSSDEANRLLAALVSCGFHRRCRSRVCPVCASMANLKRFDSVATSIRTSEDKYDFLSFTVTASSVVTADDVAVQHLRATLNAMSAKITKQIERRKDIIQGAFIAFETIPAPAAESGSERLDLEHAHAHVLLAVPKGMADHRQLEVFQAYRDFKVISADRAISASYYNCKASVFGSFTKNWMASLEHNFVERATQLSGFRRYRCTGIFRDRELPAPLQKSLEQLEEELHASEDYSTNSVITSINPKENLCVPDSTQVQSLESRSMDSSSSTRQDTIMKAAFKSKSIAIAVDGLEPAGIAFAAAAKRVPVAAVAFRCDTSSWKLEGGEWRPPPQLQQIQVKGG